MIQVQTKSEQTKVLCLLWFTMSMISFLAGPVGSGNHLKVNWSHETKLAFVGTRTI